MIKIKDIVCHILTFYIFSHLNRWLYFLLNDVLSVPFNTWQTLPG